MKNIHVLPTDKPSILFIENDDKELCLFDKPMIAKYCINQNIYITSDEEIKKNDYVIAYGVVIKVMMFDKETLYFINGTKAKREDCKKIILTTDQDLIKDGVQAIDDEFLEWFVKNPSCYEANVVFNCRGLDGHNRIGEYKIIIPKEEPKQETLEEAATKEGLYRASQNNFNPASAGYNAKWFKRGALFGAKWQQERMYSEEDMKEMYSYGYNNFLPEEDAFKQFKKK